MMAVGAGRKKQIDREEQQFQIALVRDLRGYILTPATVVLHVPNGGKRNKVEAAILKAMGVLAGFHDLLFLNSGRAFLIELKRDDGALSKTQRETHALVAATGTPMAVCRTIDDVLAQLRTWNIPTRIKGAMA